MDLGYRMSQRTTSSNSSNFLKILVDPSEPTVDIVAVHGLNPLDKESHAEATWTSGGRLWLRDLLPTRAPNARILLFGYNANVAFRTTAAGLREQAENLLNQLDRHRAEEPSRPLIFICHSLGGLMVKRALVHSKADETYKMIWGSTYGIVFFGTPHKGGNHAGMGDMVAKIARSILGNPNNTFMSSLKKDSQFLDTITDDFRQLLEDFQILSFYETQPLGRLGIVVDQKSAVLGLPGTREKQLALEANHSNICKFSCGEDPRYQLVADNIIDMIESACSSQKRSSSMSSCPRGNDSSSEGQHNAVLQAGNGNACRACGNANKTYQFGNMNNSKSDGDGNETTQISIGAIDMGSYKELFSFLNWVHS
ncbi:uncharacterized protein GGS22DRAFT_192610 [Annulohypoxylon maeteangense]|uniref:uncharacterized protein n=1 Tax=Annulohypoxylon maeteangense TaxID=1927788 RepID=UPI002008BE50|nr:uncharacterized protein GGS22DRAFT_192610 [Annulohypoxylon maeteangense]KAI0881123.1 hypothetical protein GGS22DRAFT_192610 [Annulohypoxylon maeteangense]